MRSRLRGAAMLLLGLAVVGLPVLAGQPPAGATSAFDVKSATLTFSNMSGQAVTCTLTNNTGHDTKDAHTPDSAIFTNETTDGGTECSGAMFILATYKDEHGTVLHAAASSLGESVNNEHLAVEGTFTSVSVDASISFTHCDPNRSATCTLDVTAAPK